MNNIFIRQVLVFLSSSLALSFFTYGLTLYFDLKIGSFPNKETGFVQNYFYYLNNLFSGNWGTSLANGKQVFDAFIIRFPATIELSLAALFFALSFGLPLGVIAAKNKGKWKDKLITSSTLIGYSMPIFWWGILLVLLFSVSLGLTPVGSRISFEYDITPVSGFMLLDTLLSKQPYSLEAFYSALHHLLLPTLVLGTVPLAIFTKVTRSAMLEVLSSSYIRTAKAKGLTSTRIIWLHATRNAMLPILTNIGLQISLLITGTLVTEIIFSWPGIGKWLLEAVSRRDYATIHGGIVAMSLVIIITNILIETASYYANPKMRFSKQ